MVRYVILLTIAGIVGSIIAIRKGHSPIGWFILCALFPLLIIVVALLPPKEKGVRSQQAVAQIAF